MVIRITSKNIENLFSFKWRLELCLTKDLKYFDEINATIVEMKWEDDFNDEDNFSDNFKRVYFFNAGKNHIHYVINNFQ